MKAVTLSLCLSVSLVSCSSERIITNSAKTAMQQLVITEATDRALDAIVWPKLSGRKVYVEIASPAAAEDQKYLKTAVTTALAYAGATPVSKSDAADVIAFVLAGSIGTEQTKKFLGIPAMQSVMLPVSVPEVAFFRSLQQTGFAKVEVVLEDRASSSVIFQAGPHSGEAFWKEFTVLLFGSYRTDTSRQRH